MAGWLVFLVFLGNYCVKLGCYLHMYNEKKKFWSLEPKWPGSNPASSAECQCKLTKHSKLLFPHLWCRNWRLPCRMTGGTKWVNCKPRTSSGLSKHCYSFRSSVRQSESPPLHPFHWVETVTQRDYMYSEAIGAWVSQLQVRVPIPVLLLSPCANLGNFQSLALSSHWKWGYYRSPLHRITVRANRGRVQKALA